MKEYDFRFSGLETVRDSAKVRMLRDVLLEVAGGFTEINPGTLTGLIPGDGLGYIIALDAEEKLKELFYKLAALARTWNLSAPLINPASDSPRRNYCFFLIPKLANRDEYGYRHNLFPPEVGAPQGGSEGKPFASGSISLWRVAAPRIVQTG